MLFDLEKKYNSYEAEKYPFTPQINKFSFRRFNKNPMYIRIPNSARHMKSTSSDIIPNRSLYASKSSKMIMDSNENISNRTKSLTPFYKSSCNSVHNITNQNKRQNTSPLEMSYLKTHSILKSDRTHINVFDLNNMYNSDLNTSRPIINISTPNRPTYLKTFSFQTVDMKNKNNGNKSDKNSNNNISKYYNTNPDKIAYIFATKDQNVDTIPIDYKKENKNIKHRTYESKTLDNNYNNNKIKHFKNISSFYGENSNLTNLKDIKTFYNSEKKSKIDHNEKSNIHFYWTNKKHSNSNSKIKNQNDKSNEFFIHFKSKNSPTAKESIYPIPRKIISNALFSPLKYQNQSINHSISNSNKDYFINYRDYSNEETKKLSTQNSKGKSITSDKENPNYNTINVNLVNNNSINSPFALKKQNLQITSKVANECFTQKTNQDDLNVTLQSINDSKLNELANHYITTDESLDNFQTCNDKGRKFGQYFK